ncbi:hypothetical protein B2A_07605, partial [mine drainage metagenome]
MDHNNQEAGARKPERRGVRRAVGVLWVALTLLYAGPYAQAEDPVTLFNLPAQPLPQAVLEFYRQSGVRAIYAATPQALKLRTHAVHGMLSGSVALARMLRGTGLTFRFESRHSVIIRPAPPGPTPRPVTHTVYNLARQANPAADQTDALLRRVDVTGSLIRGVRSALAPITTVGRAQLEQA